MHIVVIYVNVHQLLVNVIIANNVKIMICVKNVMKLVHNLMTIRDIIGLMLLLDVEKSMILLIC